MPYLYIYGNQLKPVRKIQPIVIKTKLPPDKLLNLWKNKNNEPFIVTEMAHDKLSSLQLPPNLYKLSGIANGCILDSLKEGDCIPISSYWKIFIKCDFQNFNINSKFNKANLHDTIEQYEEAIAPIMETFPQNMQTKEVKEVFVAVAEATEECLFLLGKPTQDSSARANSFNSYGKELGAKIKPLSDCKNNSLCAEYSILFKHLLDKLGVQSTFWMGSVGENQNPHAFLSCLGGKIIIDPLGSIEQLDQDSGSLPLILLPSKPFTIRTLNENSSHSIACRDLFGSFYQTPRDQIYGI